MKDLFVLTMNKQQAGLNRPAALLEATNKENNKKAMNVDTTTLPTVMFYRI